jgi:isocitrate/isopropylmalate dehydrogenase
MTRIAFLPGDGIGREVLPAARTVLEAAGFKGEWLELPVGWDEWTRNGDALPPATIAAMDRTKAAFFGAITSKGEAEAMAELSPKLRNKGLRYESPILRLRRTFDLAINYRPVRAWPGIEGRAGADMHLFRENTEDVYAGVEVSPVPEALINAWEEAGVRKALLPAPGPDTAITARVITRRRTQALVDAAFDFASRRKRRKVTLLEKANVMRRTGALVQDVFRGAAARHPSIQHEELQIDAACALVVRDPARFDVVAATNLFGDIFSDVAAEMGGGLGLAPSANIGTAYALFEPVHGSAPDIAGQGIANPVAAVLSGALLAGHLGQPEVARRVEDAVLRWFRDGQAKTKDLGGRATTTEAAKELARLASSG